MHRNQIRRLTLTAMFIALGYLLPFLTGQIPQFGAMLSRTAARGCAWG